MSDTETDYTETHPFPGATIREYPASAAPGDRPTHHVYVDGWRVGGNYRTGKGALAAAERARCEQQGRGPEWHTIRCEECDWKVEINRFGDRGMCGCTVGA